jgi:hypothetical protein
VLVLYIFNQHGAELHTPLDVSPAAPPPAPTPAPPCTAHPALYGREKVPLAQRGCRAAATAGQLGSPGLCCNPPPRQPPPAAPFIPPTTVPQVLRRFLSVLGAFDWERYCLSLAGPIPLDALRDGQGAPCHSPSRPPFLCFFSFLKL